MNPVAPYKQSKISKPSCADFMTMAERELAAFLNAVAQLFGPEERKLSAEDWLQELNRTERLPASTREWRSITAKASTRLAGRVNPSSRTTEPQFA
jgi:hypothetical protein